MVEKSPRSTDDSNAFVVLFDAYSSLITADEQGQYSTPYEANAYLTALKKAANGPDNRKVFLVA